MNAPMATAPNAAIPLITKKKLTRDELATARGHAAGIICVSPAGKVLLLRRADHDPNFAGHWSLPGGGAEANETPARAARREAKEEMGYSVKGPLVLLDQKVTPTGMVFHTFMHAAEDEFVPKLNEEHTGFAWAPLHALPRPMHPAVEGLLNRNVGMSSDMKPEDWKNLEATLAKFLKEEEAEPEHAEDKSGQFEREIVLQVNGDFNWRKFLQHIYYLGAVGASRPIYVTTSDDEQVPFGWDGDGADKIVTATIDGVDILSKKALAGDMARDESIHMPDVDGRLHVHGANICMECVSGYRGREIPGYQKLGLDAETIYPVYRPGDELRKPETIASANGIPLLREHKATSADDHKYWDTIGATGTTARWEAPFIVNDLAVWPTEDIKLIEARKKKELSPGYRWIPVLEDGKFDGQSYKLKMTQILFNHLAHVIAGRQGPDVSFDTAEELQWAAIEAAITGLEPAA